MTRNAIQSAFYTFAAFAICGLLATPAFAQVTGVGGGSCTAGTLGGMICNIINGTEFTPGLIVGFFAYMAGLVCGFLGIIKLKEHVESPNQVPIWDPMKRFAAGGAFLVMPYVVDVIRTTIEDGGSDFGNGGFNGDAAGAGLDAMIVALMGNILTPTMWAAGWVAWIGGLIFVFIGISRLLKTEQEGPRGPAGIGTIATFLTAGCLFSLNSMVSFINGSIFGGNDIQTNAVLQYTDGLNGAEDHVHAVISAIIAFSIMIGWISLVRGIFMVRSVSEGNSQASMMAALTHLIGGVLAINLGGVVMAVQETLGITPYGIVIN